MVSTLGGVSVTKALVREVWGLVVPVIIQGMVVTVVFFTDRLLIGQYSDTALASMQISGVLLWSLFSVFGAFTAGTMAVIGRAVGGRLSFKYLGLVPLSYRRCLCLTGGVFVSLEAPFSY